MGKIPTSIFLMEKVSLILNLSIYSIKRSADCIS
jgi:hypothetical protein